MPLKKTILTIFRRTFNQKYILPSLGRVVVFVFIFTNIAFGHKPAVNVWKDRQYKRAPQLASLPASLMAPHIFPKASFPTLKKALLNDSPAIRAALKKNTKNHPLYSSRLNKALIQQIPSSLLSHFNVRKVHASKGPQTVFIIEDVHGNPEAQKHISEGLKSFGQKPGDQPVLVGLEGASGGFLYDLYKKFPDQNVAKAVADAYFKRGDISGPAHAGFTSEAAPGLKGLRFWGIDSPEVYRNNVRAYKVGAKNQAEIFSQIEAIKKKFQKEKKTAFSTKLKTFDALVQAHREDDPNYGAYVENLSAYNVPFSLTVELFLQANRTEQSLDFDRVETERRKVLEQLVERMEESELQHLVGLSMGYQAGQITFADYYTHLKNLCAQLGVNLRNTLHFDDYIRYVLLADGIEAEKLFEDIADLESEIYQKLTRTDQQKRLVSEDRQLYLIRMLTKFGLTTGQWDEYKANKQLFKNDLDLTAFEGFYRAAQARDEAMTRNIISAMKEDPFSLVVVGGFHTPGFTERLRQKNLSTVVLTPKITKVKADSAAHYLSVFDRERSPLQQIFSGKKLFIVNTPAGAITPLLRKLRDVTSTLFNSVRALTAAVNPRQFVKADAVADESGAETSDDTVRVEDGVTIVTSNVGPAKIQTQVSKGGEIHHHHPGFARIPVQEDQVELGNDIYVVKTYKKSAHSSFGNSALRLIAVSVIGTLGLGLFINWVLLGAPPLESLAALFDSFQGLPSVPGAAEALPYGIPAVASTAAGSLGFAFSARLDPRRFETYLTQGEIDNLALVHAVRNRLNEKPREIVDPTGKPIGVSFGFEPDKSGEKSRFNFVVNDIGMLVRAKISFTVWENTSQPVVEVAVEEVKGVNPQSVLDAFKHALKELWLLAPPDLSPLEYKGTLTLPVARSSYTDGDATVAQANLTGVIRDFPHLRSGKWQVAKDSKFVEVTPQMVPEEGQGRVKIDYINPKTNETLASISFQVADRGEKQIGPRYWWEIHFAGLNDISVGPLVKSIHKFLGDNLLRNYVFTAGLHPKEHEITIAGLAGKVWQSLNLNLGSEKIVDTHGDQIFGEFFGDFKIGQEKSPMDFVLKDDEKKERARTTLTKTGMETDQPEVVVEVVAVDEADPRSVLDYFRKALPAQEIIVPPESESTDFFRGAWKEVRFFAFGLPIGLIASYSHVEWTVPAVIGAVLLVFVLWFLFVAAFGLTFRVVEWIKGIPRVQLAQFLSIFIPIGLGLALLTYSVLSGGDPEQGLAATGIMGHMTAGLGWFTMANQPQNLQNISKVFHPRFLKIDKPRDLLVDPRFLPPGGDVLAYFPKEQPNPNQTHFSVFHSKAEDEEGEEWKSKPVIADVVVGYDRDKPDLSLGVSWKARKFGKAEILLFEDILDALIEVGADLGINGKAKFTFDRPSKLEVDSHSNLLDEIRDVLTRGLSLWVKGYSTSDLILNVEHSRPDNFFMAQAYLEDESVKLTSVKATEVNNGQSITIEVDAEQGLSVEELSIHFITELFRRELIDLSAESDDAAEVSNKPDIKSSAWWAGLLAFVLAVVSVASLTSSVPLTIPVLIGVVLLVSVGWVLAVFAFGVTFRVVAFLVSEARVLIKEVKAMGQWIKGAPRVQLAPSLSVFIPVGLGLGLLTYSVFSGGDPEPGLVATKVIGTMLGGIGLFPVDPQIFKDFEKIKKIKTIQSMEIKESETHVRVLDTAVDRFDNSFYENSRFAVGRDKKLRGPGLKTLQINDSDIFDILIDKRRMGHYQVFGTESDDLKSEVVIADVTVSYDPVPGNKGLKLGISGKGDIFEKIKGPLLKEALQSLRGVAVLGRSGKAEFTLPLQLKSEEDNPVSWKSEIHDALVNSMRNWILGNQGKGALITLTSNEPANRESIWGRSYNATPSDFYRPTKAVATLSDDGQSMTIELENKNGRSVEDLSILLILYLYQAKIIDRSVESDNVPEVSDQEKGSTTSESPAVDIKSGSWWTGLLAFALAVVFTASYFNVQLTATVLIGAFISVFVGWVLVVAAFGLTFRVVDFLVSKVGALIEERKAVGELEKGILAVEQAVGPDKVDIGDLGHASVVDFLLEKGPNGPLFEQGQLGSLIARARTQPKDIRFLSWAFLVQTAQNIKKGTVLSLKDLFAPRSKLGQSLAAVAYVGEDPKHEEADLQAFRKFLDERNEIKNSGAVVVVRSGSADFIAQVRQLANKFNTRVVNESDVPNSMDVENLVQLFAFMKTRNNSSPAFETIAESNFKTGRIVAYTQNPASFYSKNQRVQSILSIWNGFMAFGPGALLRMLKASVRASSDA